MISAHPLVLCMPDGDYVLVSASTFTCLAVLPSIPWRVPRGHMSTAPASASAASVCCKGCRTWTAAEMPSDLALRRAAGLQVDGVVAVVDADAALEQLESGVAVQQVCVAAAVQAVFPREYGQYAYCHLAVHSVATTAIRAVSSFGSSRARIVEPGAAVCSRPLQHVQVPTSCSIVGRPHVPWATMSARPLQHLLVPSLGGAVAGAGVPRF